MKLSYLGIIAMPFSNLNMILHSGYKLLAASGAIEPCYN